MPKAIWKGTVIAESDKYESVEGNVYFPPDAVKKEFLKPNPQTTRCPWKGEAHYYDVEVKGEKNPAAAWYYPEPKAAASNIRNHVAFWHGVEVKS